MPRAFIWISIRGSAWDKPFYSKGAAIFPILMVENRNAAAAVAWQAWQKATVVRREGVEQVT